MGGKHSTVVPGEGMKKQDEGSTITATKPPISKNSSGNRTNSNTIHPSGKPHLIKKLSLIQPDKLIQLNLKESNSKSDRNCSKKAQNVENIHNFRTSEPNEEFQNSSHIKKISLKSNHESDAWNKNEVILPNNSQVPASNKLRNDMASKKSSARENDQRSVSAFSKTKPIRQNSAMRKASSIQSVNKAGVNSANELSKTNVIMKRANSTQNIQNKADGHGRILTSVEVMPYNADLLANFEKEKKLYESRISELVQLAEGRKAEIEKNKIELKRLNGLVPSHDLQEEIEMLRYINKSYYECLKEHGVPVETSVDGRKLSSQLNKQVSGSDEIPSSVSLDSLSIECNIGSVSVGNTISETVECSETPSVYDDLGSEQNWDKQSNKSSDTMSEVALQNLTERILEMEETNYSTTEELQATLQELGDLQDTVNSLTDQNERLAMERELLFQSLHTQTQKLQKSRSQNEHLKNLLTGTATPDKTEKEKLLEDLLKSADEQKEELSYLNKEYTHHLSLADSDNKELLENNKTFKTMIDQLESKVKGLTGEKQTLENQIIQLNETNSHDKIEINKLKSLYDSEKTRVLESQERSKAIEKLDVEDLLNKAKIDKEKLEDKLTATQESLALSQYEINKLRDQLTRKEEDVKNIRSSSKTQFDSCEVRLKAIENEKEELLKEISSLRDQVTQVELDCDQHLEDKKKFELTILEIKNELNVEKQTHLTLQAQMKDQKLYHEEKNTEWSQFQKDLQLAVVVANDFRTEKELEIEELKKQKQMVIDQNQQLLSEMSVVKEELAKLSLRSAGNDLRLSKSLNVISHQMDSHRLTPSSPVEKELVALRESRGPEANKKQSLSVKNLIKSIEDHVKCTEFSANASTYDEESSHMTDHRINKSPSSEASKIIRRNTVASDSQPLKSMLKKTTPERATLQRHTSHITRDKVTNSDNAVKSSSASSIDEISSVPSSIASILSRTTGTRRSSLVGDSERRDSTSSRDPLQVLVKQMGGSKRNALLKWCQQKTISYTGVDITNFSSSWNDGLAFCAILHNYLPDKVPFKELTSEDKKKNFLIAFEAAESVGIKSILEISDMAAIERPDWQAVMSYVTSIYKHFELDNKVQP